MSNARIRTATPLILIGAAATVALFPASSTPMLAWGLLTGLFMAARRLLVDAADRHAALAPLDPPPGEGEIAFVLGSTRLGRRVWMAEHRLLGNVSLAGPAAGRAAMFGHLRTQAALTGLGYVHLSTSETEASALAAPAAAGRADDALFIDLDVVDFAYPSTRRGGGSGASLASFSSLDADAVLRVIFFACPALSSADDPAARRAAALLEAVVPAMVWMRDEGLADFSASMIPHALRLGSVVDYASRDAFPDLPPALRARLKIYLESLPGFKDHDGRAQPAAAVAAHAEAAAFADIVMRPFVANWRVAGGPSAELGNGDVVNPRRLLTVRLPAGLGRDPRAATLTRFVLGWLIEEIRLAGPAPYSQPFPVFADGLPDDIATHLETFVRTSGAGFPLVMGIDDHGRLARTDVAATYGTAISLPGGATGPQDSDTASVTSAIRPRRSAEFVPTEEIPAPPDGPGSGHFIAVSCPNPLDVKRDETLPRVAEALSDTRLAGAIRREAQERRGAIEKLADDRIDPTTLPDEISACATTMLRGLDATAEDHLIASCAAIAAVTMATIARPGGFPEPKRREPSWAPPDPDPEDFDAMQDAMQGVPGDDEFEAMLSEDGAAHRGDGSFGAADEDGLEMMPEPGADFETPTDWRPRSFRDPPPRLRREHDSAAGLDFNLDFDDGPPRRRVEPPAPRPPPPAAPDPNRLVVVPTGGPAKSSDTSLAGVPLRCVRVSDPAEAIDRLVRRAPHLAKVAERLITEAASRSYVHFRPTLLVGPYGAGKSRFARHLCDAVGLYSIRYSCGGAADASIAGTSRQWASARPSVPLQAVMNSKTANPCVILDELSRTAEGRYNGSLVDAILDLTEPGTARRFFDIGSELHVDLSRVVWIATCNDVSQVPQVLLDRFRTIAIPTPTVEYAPALIRSISEEIAAERGLDPHWANVYSENEIDMIAEAWGGGSLRRLRALMDKVTDAVDRIDPRRLN